MLSRATNNSPHMKTNWQSILDALHELKSTPKRGRVPKTVGGRCCWGTWRKARVQLRHFSGVVSLLQPLVRPQLQTFQPAGFK